MSASEYEISIHVRRFVLAVLLISLTTTVLQPSAAQLNSFSPRNVILFYDDYPTRGDPNFQVTQEIVRPLVAHLDFTGKPTGWMFDSFIYYSYYLYYQKNPKQRYIDSWISYLFDGRQIANLDAAVGEMKTSLDQPMYQMGVFLALPVSIDQVTSQQISRNIDKMFTMWNKLSPPNLRLLGFYWGFTEDLNSITMDRLLVQDSDRAILRTTADYVHSKSLKLLMIPYRSAAGKDEFHSLGVDYVTIQPNYASDPKSDLTRFAKVDSYIRLGYSDGVELELPASVKCCAKDWRLNLQTYSNQSISYGWNHLLNTYYHGSDISLMARNRDQDHSTAYEMIFQYILSSR